MMYHACVDSCKPRNKKRKPLVLPHTIIYSLLHHFQGHKDSSSYQFKNVVLCTSLYTIYNHMNGYNLNRFSIYKIAEDSLSILLLFTSRLVQNSIWLLTSSLWGWHESFFSRITKTMNNWFIFKKYIQIQKYFQSSKLPFVLGFIIFLRSFRSLSRKLDEAVWSVDIDICRSFNHP